MTMPYEKEIIEKIVIKKDGRKSSYQMFRNSRGDFPILNLAASRTEAGQWIVTVGARGPKAIRAEKTAAFLSDKLSQKALKAEDVEAVIQEAGEILVSEVTFTSNMRASAEYRRILGKVLLGKAVREVMACSFIFLSMEKREKCIASLMPCFWKYSEMLAARVSNAAVIQPTAVFVPYGWTANRCCPVLFRQPE